MEKKIQKEGQCLCGAVKVKADQLDAGLGACHCGTCRKWGGGPYMAVDGGTDFSFEGKESITDFNSSDWAERGFCSKCGTHLYYKLKETGQHIFSLGLFDEDDLAFDHQIFVDKKSKLYTFADQTLNMTEAEVFEKFFNK